MLYIDNANIEVIKNHVKRCYPKECCGLLIGTNNAEKKVLEVRPVRNVNTERTHDRYEIDPKDYSKIDKEVSKRKLHIIGIYHSHPDHPAVPSLFDKEHAFGIYSYVIVAIENGGKMDIRSWVLDEEQGTFVEEEIYFS